MISGNIIISLMILYFISALTIAVISGKIGLFSRRGKLLFHLVIIFTIISTILIITVL